jgi:uncharacterized membrane protein
LLLRVPCCCARFLQLALARGKPSVGGYQQAPTYIGIRDKFQRPVKKNYFVQYGVWREFSTPLCFFLDTIGRQTGLSGGAGALVSLERPFMTSVVAVHAFVLPFLPPSDMPTNHLMFLRWVHSVAGIAWVGLLYFFNLVNVPFLKELDAPTKSKVFPALMSRALWWFRWSSVVTVLAGLGYWMSATGSDARNAAAATGAAASPGAAFGSFFAIWTVVFALIYALIMVAKINNGAMLGVGVAVLVGAGSYLYLALNNHGWESNRLLAIGIGGGLGWIMMMNVWGIIWRINKKLIRWHQEFAANGTAIPAEAVALGRMAFLASRTNFWLSFPLLFLMGAASHWPAFGR